MAESRDPAELRDLWVGWHAASRRRCATRYARFVSSTNKGAQRARVRRHGRAVAVELRHAARPVLGGGRAAVAAGPAALRVAARVRAPASAPSGTAPRVVPADGPIPAHLLGNHLGAGVGQHLRRSWRPPARTRGIRRHRAAARAEDRRAEPWSARARASSRRSGSSRCRRRSGSARCSPSPRIATSSATRARGTSTTSRTCA